jgi:hypothetical protein
MGLAALDEAAETMEKLSTKSVDWPYLASHLFTGSLASIGKLPALAGQYIWFGIFVL